MLALLGEIVQDGLTVWDFSLMAETALHVVFLFQRAILRLLTVSRKFPVIGEDELQSSSISQEVTYVTFINDSLTKASYMAIPIFQRCRNTSSPSGSTARLHCKVEYI